MSRHSDVPIFARRHAPMHPRVHAKIMREMEQDVAGEEPYRVVPSAEKNTIGWVDEKGRVRFFTEHEQAPQHGHEMAFLLTLAAFCIVMGLGLAWCIV